MAAIVGIPNSLYEVSYINGANKFDMVYNMTQGGSNNKTGVLATHLYNQGFKYLKYGYASTISIFLLGLSLVVTFVINQSIN